MSVDYDWGFNEGFESGREEFAADMLEFLRNYDEDESVPVQDLEEFIDLMLGYDPDTDDSIIQEVLEFEADV
jgi:hypothetical protein